MFFLQQLAARLPPIVLPYGVSGRHRGRLFPQNEHFSEPPKGGDMMAVFRIEKTRDYTVMSNHHLRNAGLSLKSKGLLSMMLSLPEDWNYTTRGLAKICKEGTDSIGSALKELERAGYIVRNRLRDSKGRSWTWSMSSTRRPIPRTRASRVRTSRIRLVQIRKTRIWITHVWKTGRN